MLLVRGVRWSGRTRWIVDEDSSSLFVSGNTDIAGTMALAWGSTLDT